MAMFVYSIQLRANQFEYVISVNNSGQERRDKLVKHVALKFAPCTAVTVGYAALTAYVSL